ncbi:hypothetical protein IEQ34_000865 [Dendrobium chrysotoxum]|uniref:Uncharacterized protein n=1 Tax=Dendrobium chrysotoxum TaxID=161865 RepID=A0AAV7HRM8_DENCH|nr:hypothetical protein IEQ34_000865 [Dendrobium chrysotoxum]
MEWPPAAASVAPRDRAPARRCCLTCPTLLPDMPYSAAHCPALLTCPMTRTPPYIEAMSVDHLPSRDLMAKGCLHHTIQNDCERSPNKGAKLDDVASTVTGYFLIALHKKFHFSNDVATTVPKRSDQACLPPPEYLTVYEISLRAGLRFSPFAELIEISVRCRVSLSQFSYRTMSGLIEKWGKMKYLSAPLLVREEDIMRILNIPDIEHLLYEVCYLNKYIEEEFLFKVGLSFYAGRFDARMLKISSKVPEPLAPASKVGPKRQARGDDPQALKKKKLEGILRSIAFKTIIQDRVQEARDHIYDAKGVRLVLQKTRVEVEGLTPSQALDDSPSDSDGDKIESEL